jgi:exodeoxyribonuclease VII large subunit
MQRELHRLQLLGQRATSLDPTLLLQRGYSITLVNGKALRDPADVKPGDEITTRLEKGTIKSKVL